jgi:hypothetical protein
MSGLFSQRLVATLMVALVAGCEGDVGERLQSGRVLALHGLQGRWVGRVVPADASCGPATQGLMSIGGKGFGFDPFQSTTVINGAVSKDGRLVGNLVRQGSDHRDFSVSFEGAVREEGSEPEVINGTVASGRCRWKVTLHRG